MTCVIISLYLLDVRSALLGPLDIEKDRLIPLASLVAAPIPAVRHR